jgi:hypothetical protein
MILKWIMKRRVWTEFSKLRMWVCAGLLWIRLWTVGFKQTPDTCWQTKDTGFFRRTSQCVQARKVTHNTPQIPAYRDIPFVRPKNETDPTSNILYRKKSLKTREAGPLSLSRQHEGRQLPGPTDLTKAPLHRTTAKHAATRSHSYRQQLLPSCSVQTLTQPVPWLRRGPGSVPDHFMWGVQ